MLLFTTFTLHIKLQSVVPSLETALQVALASVIEGHFQRALTMAHSQNARRSRCGMRSVLAASGAIKAGATRLAISLRPALRLIEGFDTPGLKDAKALLPGLA